MLHLKDIYLYTIACEIHDFFFNLVAEMREKCKDKILDSYWKESKEFVVSVVSCRDGGEIAL